MLERHEGATVTETHVIANGMSRVIYELPEGLKVRGYFISTWDGPRSSRSTDEVMPFQVAGPPYASARVGMTVPVLANVGSSVWARNAVGEEGSPGSRTRTLWWVGATVLAFLPCLPICLSALTRKEIHPVGKKKRPKSRPKDLDGGLDPQQERPGRPRVWPRGRSSGSEGSKGSRGSRRSRGTEESDGSGWLPQ